MATLRSSSTSPDTSDSETRHWVLIRGLIRSSFHWHRFPEILQQTFPEDIIHCIDIPGNGQRFHESTPFSVRGMAEDIKRQLDALRSQHPQENIHIIAISMGTMITADILSDREQDIRSAHLINGSAGNLSAPWQRMLPLSLIRIMCSLIPAGRRELSILRCTSSLPESDLQGILKDWTNEAQRHPVSLRNTLAQLFASLGIPSESGPG